MPNHSKRAKFVIFVAEKIIKFALSYYIAITKIVGHLLPAKKKAQVK